MKHPERIKLMPPLDTWAARIEDLEQQVGELHKLVVEIHTKVFVDPELIPGVKDGTSLEDSR